MDGIQGKEHRRGKKKMGNRLRMRLLVGIMESLKSFVLHF
jgi:hypothetical protein